MQGVSVQVSARERLLRPETRNLKPGTLNQTLDPRFYGILSFGIFHYWTKVQYPTSLFSIETP